MSRSRTSRSLLLAATVATAGLSVTSAAHAADVPFVATPLQAVSERPTVATGEGQVAWTVPDGPDASTATLWTLHDGTPVALGAVAASVSLEVGTDAAGRPLVVVGPRGVDANAGWTTVDLGSGERVPLVLRTGGRVLSGVALDRGRVLYTLQAARPTSRSTSTLWSASLAGSVASDAARQRTSQRGMTLAIRLADRRRVALRTSVRKGAGYRTAIAFGTLRGTWARTGTVDVETGPVPTVDPAGFTRDGGRLVTVTSGVDLVPAVQARAVPIAGGGTRTVTFPDTSRQELSAGYDAATARLLVGTVGYGAAPVNAVGWSGALPFSG